MSQVRDIELDVAYLVNLQIDRDLYVMSKREIDNSVDDIFDGWVATHEYDHALYFDSKYVVLARYDENQYSSPPNMRIFGIFSSKDKAKDSMAVWAINRGLGNEMLATCTYDWVLIDGVSV